MAIRRLGSEGVVAFGIEADALDEIVARAAAADRGGPGPDRGAGGRLAGLRPSPGAAGFLPAR